MADSVEVSTIETTDGTIGIIRDNAARQSIANLREGKETVGSVAWENVKGRPTKVSSFENDKKYQTDENVSNTLNSTLYAGSSTHGGPATSADKLTTARTISLGGAASGSGSFDGSANSTINVSSLDATKLTGVVPITNLPPSVVERMSIVKDDTERFALTTDSVHDGDVVKVQSTNLMYYIVDDTKLSSEAGYEVFKAGSAASVPWGGVTGKPSTFPPSAHTHTKSQITDLGVFGGASATAAGSAGLVPQPAAGDQDKYLSAKGTWESITGKISGTKVESANSADSIKAYTIRPASANKLFADGKLRYFLATSKMTEGKPTVGDAAVLDLAWDNTNSGGWDAQIAIPIPSKGPLQIRSMESGTWQPWKSIAYKSDIPTSLPASDVSAWAKASSKPSYSWSEITGKPSSYPPSAHNHDSSYLKLSGGTMTGQLLTSFKSAVATGSYQAAASTVPDLIQEVRYSSGCMGSVQLTTAYNEIPAAWYNFLYIPHRSGGMSGAVNGDNCNFGTLLLFGMTTENQAWVVEFRAGNIVGAFSIRNTDTTYGLASQSSNGLMSAADKKAVDREFFRLLPKGGTHIPANADLNTIEYIKVGNYYNSLSRESRTMKNIPVGSAFIMYVLAPLSEVYDNESTDQWVYRLRIFIEITGQYIFTQQVNSGVTPGNFTYGPWVKMTNSNDLGAVSNKSAKYTLAASNWSGSSAPYTYDLGPTYGANAIIGFDSAVGNTTQLEAARAADIQGSSTTKIYAYGDKPTVDIPIVIIYQ